MDFNNFVKLAHTGKESKKKGNKFYNLERKISVRLSWILFRLFPSIKPSFITFISILVLFISFFINFVNFSSEMVRVYVGLGQMVMFYSISFFDKMDGEIARVKDYCTQKGLYYDRAVHFLYPLIFYFSIGNIFYGLYGSIELFFLTILLGLLVQMRLFFHEARYTVKEVFSKSNFEIKDLIDVESRNLRKKKRPPLVLRLLDYFSYMIYSWALFFYVFVFIIFIFSSSLSFYLYLGHIIVSLVIVTYRVFYSNPKWGLLTTNFR